eukprot:g1645.t1
MNGAGALTLSPATPPMSATAAPPWSGASACQMVGGGGGHTEGAGHDCPRKRDGWQNVPARLPGGSAEVPRQAWVEQSGFLQFGEAEGNDKRKELKRRPRGASPAAAGCGFLEENKEAKNKRAPSNIEELEEEQIFGTGELPRMGYNGGEPDCKFDSSGGYSIDDDKKRGSGKWDFDGAPKSSKFQTGLPPIQLAGRGRGSLGATRWAMDNLTEEEVEAWLADRAAEMDKLRAEAILRGVNLNTSPTDVDVERQENNGPHTAGIPHTINTEDAAPYGPAKALERNARKE